MPITAFAFICTACCSIISKASSRARSHMDVNKLMFPPTIVCSDPPIVPKIERERTVMPRTSPSERLILKPGSSMAVVVISCFTPERSTDRAPRLSRSGQLFARPVAEVGRQLLARDRLRGEQGQVLLDARGWKARQQ